MGDVTPRLADIDLLVTDFDGVLTDNRVLVSDDGHESVVCTRADGIGCDLLNAAGRPKLLSEAARLRETGFPDFTFR